MNSDSIDYGNKKPPGIFEITGGSVLIFYVPSSHEFK